MILSKLARSRDGPDNNPTRYCSTVVLAEGLGLAIGVVFGKGRFFRVGLRELFRKVSTIAYGI